MIRALSTACAVLALGLFVADDADARGRGGGKRSYGFSHSHAHSHGTKVRRVRSGGGEGGGAVYARGGRCNYCGCKGGPGYRAPDGKCVGKRNITKVCGSPPSTRCKFEGRSGQINQTPNPSYHPKVVNPFAVEG